jgi:hypothetical protein
LAHRWAVPEEKPSYAGPYSSILILYPKGDLIRTALSVKLDVRIVNQFAQISEGSVKLEVDDLTITIDYNPINKYLQKLVFGFVIKPIEEL